MHLTVINCRRHFRSLFKARYLKSDGKGHRISRDDRCRAERRFRIDMSKSHLLRLLLSPRLLRWHSLIVISRRWSWDDSACLHTLQKARRNRVTAILSAPLLAPNTVLIRLGQVHPTQGKVQICLPIVQDTRFSKWISAAAGANCIDCPVVSKGPH